MDPVKIRSATIKYLDKRFHPKSIKGLIDVTERLEAHIQCVLRGILLKNVAQWAIGASYDKGLEAIMADNATYELRLGRDPVQPSVVKLALMRGGTNIDQREHKQVPVLLEGHGACKEALIWTPKAMRIDAHQLASATSAVFQSGYSWFETKVDEVIRRSSADLAHSLYSCLRPHIPDEKLRNSVWFGAGVKGRAFFVVDSDRSNAALDVLSEDHLGPASPYTFLSELLAASLPVEQTFALHAVADRGDDWQCRDYDLSDSRYRENMPRMAQAEIKVLGPSSISILPIAVKKSSYLVAVFPTTLKNDLLHVLEERREDLRSRFLHSYSRLPKLIQTVDEATASPSIYGKVGEIMGGIMKGMASP